MIAEPQPAELITIASTPARSNSSIVRLANSAASVLRPECSDSAPQQPWPRGITTSQPSAASTLAVAAFTWGKNTDCTQPVSIPTTARLGPSALTRSGSLPLVRADGGASRIAASSVGEIRSGSPVRSRPRSSLLRCASRSGAVSSRSRLG